MSALPAPQQQGSDHRVLVAGELMWLTRHAVERYIERVRPTLPYASALREINAVLRHATVTRVVPDFCSAGSLQTGAMASRWVCIGEDIAFTAVGSRLTTCILRGVLSEEDRAQRAARRHKRQSKRRSSGLSGGRRLDEQERHWRSDR